MGAVGGAEGIVHEDVPERGQCLGVRRIVLFLLPVETQVLQQEHVAGPGRLDGRFDLRPHRVRQHLDTLAQQFAQSRGHRSQAEIVLWFGLRAAEVGTQDHDGTVVEEVLDRRDRLADSPIVGDVQVLVQGHVKVTADQRPLAGPVDVAHSLLVHR